MKRGEIYYADLSPVVGSEQGGTRPVVVIQNDLGNKHSPTTIVAAITSKGVKAEMPTHVAIKGEGLNRASMVLLEQIRTIDKCRIKEKIMVLHEDEMKSIDVALAISVGLRSI